MTDRRDLVVPSDQFILRDALMAAQRDIRVLTATITRLTTREPVKVSGPVNGIPAVGSGQKIAVGTLNLGAGWWSLQASFYNGSGPAAFTLEFRDSTATAYPSEMIPSSAYTGSLSWLYKGPCTVTLYITNPTGAVITPSWTLEGVPI